MAKMPIRAVMKSPNRAAAIVSQRRCTNIYRLNIINASDPWSEGGWKFTPSPGAIEGDSARLSISRSSTAQKRLARPKKRGRALSFRARVDAYCACRSLKFQARPRFPFSTPFAHRVTARDEPERGESPCGMSKPASQRGPR
jgi:hypothetical protein